MFFSLHKLCVTHMNKTKFARVLSSCLRWENCQTIQATDVYFMQVSLATINVTYTLKFVDRHAIHKSTNLQKIRNQVSYEENIMLIQLHATTITWLWEWIPSTRAYEPWAFRGASIPGASNRNRKGAPKQAIAVLIKIRFVLSSNMAALSRGCKPRIHLEQNNKVDL